jgi:hypothetical protein
MGEQDLRQPAGRRRCQPGRLPSRICQAPAPVPGPVGARLRDSTDVAVLLRGPRRLQLRSTRRLQRHFQHPLFSSSGTISATSSDGLAASSSTFDTSRFFAKKHTDARRNYTHRNKQRIMVSQQSKQSKINNQRKQTTNPKNRIW